MAPLLPHPHPSAGVITLGVATFFLNASKGFNAHGLIPTVGGTAALALLNTQMAVAAGVFSYGLMEVAVPKTAALLRGEVTLLGAAKGAVIGLVATSSGAAFIQPMWTVQIVFIAVTLVYLASFLTRTIKAAGVDAFLVVRGCSSMPGSRRDPAPPCFRPPNPSPPLPNPLRPPSRAARLWRRHRCGVHWPLCRYLFGLPLERLFPLQ